jgi:hypothetical protein
MQSCALGYYSFGHEMAHGFGLAHDRKATSSSSTDYAFGYIIQVRYGALESPKHHSVADQESLFSL